jgi:hypothetical protein
LGLQNNKRLDPLVTGSRLIVLKLGLLRGAFGAFPLRFHRGGHDLGRQLNAEALVLCPPLVDIGRPAVRGSRYGRLAALDPVSASGAGSPKRHRAYALSMQNAFNRSQALGQLTTATAARGSSAAARFAAARRAATVLVTEQTAVVLLAAARFAAAIAATVGFASAARSSGAARSGSGTARGSSSATAARFATAAGFAAAIAAALLVAAFVQPAEEFAMLFAAARIAAIVATAARFATASWGRSATAAGFTTARSFTTTTTTTMMMERLRIGGAQHHEGAGEQSRRQHNTTFHGRTPKNETNGSALVFIPSVESSRRPPSHLALIG